jgi:ectoine hydroxylase-related dioxygenase (phytanoyl-CoA dioxygenase family)
VAAEVDRVEAARDAWLEGQPDHRSWISTAGVVDFAPNLVRASTTLKAFSASSPLTDICLDLIGPDVRVYFDQAVYKRPTAAGTELPWHQDNGYNFKRPEAYLTIWVPLDDVDEDNGCLWVIPAAHREGTGRHHRNKAGFLVCQVDAAQAVQVLANAGDIVVLSSLVPHATGANRSDRIRRAYLISYVADGTCLRDGTACADPDTQYLVLQRGEIAGSSGSPGGES